VLVQAIPRAEHINIFEELLPRDASERVFENRTQLVAIPAFDIIDALGSLALLSVIGATVSFFAATRGLSGVVVHIAIEECQGEKGVGKDKKKRKPQPCSHQGTGCFISSPAPGSLQCNFLWLMPRRATDDSARE
jgi:hypothetical protein